MVKFCDDCKSLVLVKPVKIEVNGKQVIEKKGVCSKCGKVYDSLNSDSYKTKKKIDHSKDMVVAIDGTNVEQSELQKYPEYELENPDFDNY